jgi:hypothetical protein
MTDESMRRDSSIRELFPPTDPAARLVVSMGLARNVLEPALVRIEADGAVDEPGFTAQVVELTGYVVEASNAWIACRDKYPEARALIEKLPREMTEDVKLTGNIQQRVGKGVLDHSRNHVFHFPAPDVRRNPDSDKQLEEVLGEQRATIITLGAPRRYRLGWSRSLRASSFRARFSSARPTNLSRTRARSDGPRPTTQAMTRRRSLTKSSPARSKTRGS